MQSPCACSHHTLVRRDLASQLQGIVTGGTDTRAVSAVCDEMNSVCECVCVRARKMRGVQCVECGMSCAVGIPVMPSSSASMDNTKQGRRSLSRPKWSSSSASLIPAQNTGSAHTQSCCAERNAWVSCKHVHTEEGEQRSHEGCDYSRRAGQADLAWDGCMVRHLEATCG